METIVKTSPRKYNPKCKVGRPPVYTPENEQAICDLVSKRLGQGATKISLATEIGVDYSTFKRWEGKHKNFREAVLSGDAAADQLVVNALFSKATGTCTTKETKLFQHEGIVTDERTVTKEYAPDTAAAKHWLKHRSSTKDEWKDVQHTENTHKLDISQAISHAAIAEQSPEEIERIATETPKPDDLLEIDPVSGEFQPFPGGGA